MTPALMLAFAGFAFANSISPGPNNTMLLASGANYGFRRSIPHILGVSVGCGVMLLLVGLGLGAVFAAVPLLYGVIRYVGAAYLLWLAWRIARAGAPAEQPAGARPMSFWQGMLFQWVNPKAWILVAGGVSTFAPRDDFAWNVAVLALLLGLVNLPSICIWAGFGTALRPLLARPARARMFNGAMALLLVASLVPILVD